MGADEAAIMLPDLPWLREAFESTGYCAGRWEGQLWIFERWLTTTATAGAA
jgi:hypothetical protein